MVSMSFKFSDKKKFENVSIPMLDMFAQNKWGEDFCFHGDSDNRPLYFFHKDHLPWWIDFILNWQTC